MDGIYPSRGSLPQTEQKNLSFGVAASMMVRCVRFWRGEWKKNGEEEWEFVTHPEDFGYTVLINETASYEMVDMIIRQRYGLPYIPHL
ncbi:hypothetical protein Bca101_082251 [Brassica carinata]